MSDPKGDKRFVNLGASQTRRRLKGFGHGVRKVQTNGHCRAAGHNERDRRAWSDDDRAHLVTEFAQR
ncbi:MAG: hypothetical protein WD875_01200 [Pirellulales bacterium]